MNQNHLDTMLVYLMILTLCDDPNRANTGINDLESSAYQKHVESRGAYVLRGSGPSQVTVHDKDDGMHNMTCGV